MSLPSAPHRHTKAKKALDFVGTAQMWLSISKRTGKQLVATGEGLAGRGVEEDIDRASLASGVVSKEGGGPDVGRYI